MPELQYAFFVEPTGELMEVIVRWKSRVEAVMPGQPLCPHPPHMTLHCGRLSDPEIWLPMADAAAKGIQPFEIETKGSHIFFDDPQTGGGQTLALRVNASPALGRLQRIISDTVAPYVNRCAIVLPPGLQREPFISSFLTYGFPFVGDHWMPHFTIASIKTGRQHPLVTEFGMGKIELRMMVSRISLWQVRGDEHTRIAICPLTKGEA